MGNILIYGVSSEQSWDVAEQLAATFSVIVTDDEIQYDFPRDIAVVQEDEDLPELSPLRGFIVFFDVSDEPGSVARKIYIDEYFEKLQHLTNQALSAVPSGGGIVFAALNSYGPPNTKEAERFFRVLENLDKSDVSKHFLGTHKAMQVPGIEICSPEELSGSVRARVPFS